jgi:chemotaxis protein methyltransferase CheR
MQSQNSIADVHAENYRFLQEPVYPQSGIVLEENKHYLLENRLTPIVRRLGLGSINDLCALLRATGGSEVGRQVVEAREDRRDTKKLRFWSAAASTGQEAYSLAMLLLAEGFTDWNIQILGTDFSSQVLERARSGKYQQIEVNRGPPAALLIKHFRRSGVDWQLSEAVCRMVNFETIDLRKSMRSLGPFDLVFCRNVMIYFDTATRKEILKQLHGTLFRGGWLMLGGAETAFGLEDLFEKQTIGNATVYVARWKGRLCLPN